MRHDRDQKKPSRVFYAAGPGDVILAHHHWRGNERCPSEVSVTFSSLIQDFCTKIGAKAYFVSSHARKEIVHDSTFTLENRPKPMPGSRGIKYHLAQIVYGLGLLRTALRFKADLAIVDSGCTHYFMLRLFSLFGIRVIPVLHNALWPKGFPITKPIPRAIHAMDTVLFWRRPPEAAICVSPECEQQLLSLIGETSRKPITYVALAQFYREHFEQIHQPPDHASSPFQIIFVGRIIRGKGVFDILEMARKIEDLMPGRVRWVLCGSGPDLEALKQTNRELGLESVVEIRGWTSPADQIEIYARSHAAIVPTRSSFAEGMAMTAIEAILAGRPLITCGVVPALDLLRPACLEARTDDLDSYVEQVTLLASDKSVYEKCQLACAELGEQFYNREKGLGAILEQAVATDTLESKITPISPDRSTMSLKFDKSIISEKIDRMVASNALNGSCKWR